MNFLRINVNLDCIYSILLFIRLLLFMIDFFYSSKISLHPNKILRQPSKIILFNSTKTLPTKHDHSLIGFQIAIRFFKKIKNKK